jgi:hypothetical protein
MAQGPEFVPVLCMQKMWGSQARHETELRMVRAEYDAQLQQQQHADFEEHLAAMQHAHVREHCS